jgi:hypothetical protein
MALTFDPANRLIIITDDTTLNVISMYSRWKEWVRTSDNAKYPPAFSTVGGEAIDASAGTAVPMYAFLKNGWRIRPKEASHTLSVVGGVILVEGGGDPFVNTIGNYNIRVNFSQPVQAITVSTGAGGGGATAAEVRDAVWNTQLSNHSTPGSMAEYIKKIPTLGKLLGIR